MYLPKSILPFFSVQFSACMKIELHLLPVSGMGKFHTLALKFGG